MRLVDKNKRIFNNKWGTWEARCQACAYSNFIFSQSECLKGKKMLGRYCHQFRPKQGDWEPRCHNCSYFEATYDNKGNYISGASCYKDNFVMSAFCHDFHQRETLMIGWKRCSYCENFYVVEDKNPTKDHVMQNNENFIMGCYREKNFNKTWCRSFYPRSSYFGSYETDKIQKYVEEHQFG